MKILQLDTGLFPDAQTVAAALRPMTPPAVVVVIDPERRDLTADDWDAALAAILAADRIVSV